MNTYKPTLYLIRGIPGSGKSTLASHMYNSEMVDFVLEADKWFVDYNFGEFDASKLYDAHKWCQHKALDLLSHGYSVAVSNTSTTENEVEVYKAITESMNANFVSIIVENRNNTKSIHNVPDETIKKMKNRFSVKL